MDKYLLAGSFCVGFFNGALLMWLWMRRWKRIVRTHDICHNLHGKVDARAFADGCATEQRKLYGCAPDADEADRLYQIVADMANRKNEPPKRRTMWG